MTMGMSERQLVAWQTRLSERLGEMISSPGDFSRDEILLAVDEARTLYFVLRQMESELRRSLEAGYFVARFSQLTVRMAESEVPEKDHEAQSQEWLLAQLAQTSDELERMAVEAGTTVEDLIMRGAEAVAEGRIKKKPGPAKGARRKPQSDGPWTPQVLKAEMARLGVTFERLGSAMVPPCGRPSVFKWIQGGIPSARQDQITAAMEKFEAEFEQNPTKP
jgi:hypothetical protein